MGNREEAKFSVKNIVNALMHYRAEYGYFPKIGKPRADGKFAVFVGDPACKVCEIPNSVLFDVLRAIPRGPNANHALNPKQLKFIETIRASDPKHPWRGFADGPTFSAKDQGCYFDPWGRQYCIVFTTNGSVTLDLSAVYSDLAGPEHLVRLSAVAFSLGKDGLPGGKGYEGKSRKPASTEAPDDIVPCFCRIVPCFRRMEQVEGNTGHLDDCSPRGFISGMLPLPSRLLHEFHRDLEVDVFQLLEADAAFADVHFAEARLVFLGEGFAVIGAAEVETDVLLLAGGGHHAGVALASARGFAVIPVGEEAADHPKLVLRDGLPMASWSARTSLRRARRGWGNTARGSRCMGCNHAQPTSFRRRLRGERFLIRGIPDMHGTNHKIGESAVQWPLFFMAKTVREK